jgi:hypothetical protein
LQHGQGFFDCRHGPAAYAIVPIAVASVWYGQSECNVVASGQAGEVIGHVPNWRACAVCSAPENWLIGILPEGSTPIIEGENVLPILEREFVGRSVVAMHV